MKTHEIAALMLGFRRFETAAVDAAWAKLDTPAKRHGWSKYPSHVYMNDEESEAGFLVVEFSGAGEANDHETLLVRLTAAEAESL